VAGGDGHLSRLARHDKESVRTSDVGSLHVQTGRQTDLGQSVELHLGRGEPAGEDGKSPGYAFELMAKN